MIESVLQTALYVIGGVVLWIIGVWLYCLMKKQRSHYMTLTKEEWKEDNDMIPVTNVMDKGEKDSIKPPAPSEQPVSVPHFFAKVQQARTPTHQPANE